jgi:uncharacterized protein with HEPN domain
MDDRRPKLLLDAIHADKLAIVFLRGVSREAYSADAMRRSAVERQLEVLGEAFVRLSQVDASLHQRLPMARVAIGMRNRIAHGYDTIDHAIVHATVAGDLPAVLAELEAWLLEVDPDA